MKRLSVLLLAVALLVCLTACGKSEAAQSVDDLIAAIGDVTLDSGTKIEAAEAAVNALSSDDAKQLANSAILVAARTTYDALVAEKAAADAEAARIAALQQQAAEVDAAIAAIGTVTADSGDAVTAARTAYDGLDAEAQGYVQNLSVLEAAEASLSSLRIAGVESLISAIGTVNLNSGDKIAAAQDAFNALSAADAAKVSNAAALTDAANQLAQLKRQEALDLLKTMAVEEDFVRNMSFYYPSAFPRGTDYWYADERSFVLPYMGMQGDEVWLRLVCNYTGNDWVFFEKITYAVDSNRYYDTFSYFDVTRDNGGGDVWEYVDINVGASEIEMLWDIANSTNTVIRFEGDDYSRDVTVSAADKEAIRQVLTAYEALGGK